MIKFIHAADLHLDSPLRNLDSYEGAPVSAIRNATRKALENLVDLAIGESVHFVLIAGDIYDGDWDDASTGLFFVRQMARLKEKSIPVFLICGNHDAANKMTRQLPYPDNVRFLSHEGPETVRIDELRVAIHGQGYANQEEKRNLATKYPSSAKGWLNIGLLHTCLDGREGHAAYAPCGLDELKSLDYDYWALGHIHQRESVNGENRPRIEYPGNIQGRHIRETEAKGCLVVTTMVGEIPKTEFRTLDVFRWSRQTVDCSELESRETVLNRIGELFDDVIAKAEGRPVALRVELTGTCSAHDSLLANHQSLEEEVRALAIANSDRLWIERIRIMTKRPLRDSEQESVSDDAFSEIVATIDSLRQDPESLATLLAIDDVKYLASRLPPELRQGDSQIPFATGDKEWLDRAQAILIEAARKKEVSR